MSERFDPIKRQFGGDMRKQDRILRDQEMNRSQEASEPGQQPRRLDREQMRDKASAEEPPKPPRPSGKLPLPE